MLKQIHPGSVSSKSSPPTENYFVTEELWYTLRLFGETVSGAGNKVHTLPAEK